MYQNVDRIINKNIQRELNSRRIDDYREEVITYCNGLGSKRRSSAQSKRI
jgi:hypothetical protein